MNPSQTALEIVQDRAPALAFVGLGGNVGDSAATLRAALHRLMTVPRSRVVSSSRFYRTPAWGREHQADFVNAVAAIETALPPRVLLDELLTELASLVGIFASLFKWRALSSRGGLPTKDLERQAEMSLPAQDPSLA